MNKLIMFLVRKKLKIKENEEFKFANQKEYCTFMFYKNEIVKFKNNQLLQSNVSLNFLLSEDCKIRKVRIR